MSLHRAVIGSRRPLESTPLVPTYGPSLNAKPRSSIDTIVLSSESQATVVDAYLSTEACRAKALDCLFKADALDDPQEKALMLRYAQWWTRLAELAQKREDQHNLTRSQRKPWTSSDGGDGGMLRLIVFQDLPACLCWPILVCRNNPHLRTVCDVHRDMRPEFSEQKHAWRSST
jgi:hypothetical protein